MASDGLASGELREPGAYSRITELLPQPDAARKRAPLYLGQATSATPTSAPNISRAWRLRRIGWVCRSSSTRLAMRLYDVRLMDSRPRSEPTDAKGQLRAGMLADLVLLSDDIADVPPEAISSDAGDADDLRWAGCI